MSSSPSMLHLSTTNFKSFCSFCAEITTPSNTGYFYPLTKYSSKNCNRVLRKFGTRLCPELKSVDPPERTKRGCIRDECESFIRTFHPAELFKNASEQSAAPNSRKRNARHFASEATYVPKGGKSLYLCNDTDAQSSRMRRPPVCRFVLNFGSPAQTVAHKGPLKLRTAVLNTAESPVITRALRSNTLR